METIVTDGVTEALDGDAHLEQMLGRLPPRHSGGDAARLCQAVMARALEGRGPEDASERDDDRTVVVTTIGAAPVRRAPSNGGSHYGHH